VRLGAGNLSIYSKRVFIFVRVQCYRLLSSGLFEETKNLREVFTRT
jgi:hypothetical protein